MKSSRFGSSSRIVRTSAADRSSTRAASSGNSGFARKTFVGSDSSNWRPPLRTSPTDCVARTSAPFLFRHVFAASSSWPATIGSDR